jgi:hypothetical protein
MAFRIVARSPVTPVPPSRQRRGRNSPAVQRPGTTNIPGLLSHMAREKQTLRYFRNEENK